MFDENTILEFEEFTGFDLGQYFTDFSDYIDNRLDNLINYYLGISDLLPSTKIAYDNLWSDSNKLNQLVIQYIHNFTRNDFAGLVEYLDEIRYKLVLIKNISRFLKSSIVSLSNKNTISTKLIVGSYQTPENVHGDSQTPQDDWTDTYITNRIYESDYDKDGGYELTKNKTNITNFDVNTIIDNFIPENLYGKDIDKNMILTETGLKLVTGIDALNQAIDITSNALKNDNPQYPDWGTDPQLVCVAMVAVNIPFIIKELTRSFSLDQSIASMDIMDITNESNQLQFNLQCTSLNNDVLQDKTLNIINS